MGIVTAVREHAAGTNHSIYAVDVVHSLLSCVLEGGTLGPARFSPDEAAGMRTLPDYHADVVNAVQPTPSP